jgi:DNA-directed RNA polymerase specialized sigma24 family protein
VLVLKDFERFVFVMSVLERYSDHESALLVGCSIQEIRDARRLAIQHISSLEDDPQGAAAER